MDVLREYIESDTNVGIGDIFKFLFQSCFGCEHFVSDYDIALMRIVDEAKSCERDDLPEVEELPGNYCRVHLKVVKSKSDLEKLCKLFVKSSEIHEDGQKKLEQYLEALLNYSEEGRIRISSDELTTAIEKWRKEGFPAVHHTEGFRRAHHPAYRVIRKEFLSELNI